ncbi:Cytosolic sulfotransferase 13 [Vitis vinifera]|uniref:Sulfotransferase n=1 Tax=Vitis vinifera TaxID=29760 RepID=A0A438JYA8_VITVI|nr:Cytosolic sulfotransferase 13 [Vitis vinifera]
MATVHPPEKSLMREDEDEKEKARKRNNEIISSLGKEEGWMEEYTYEYQGFWYPSVTVVEGVMWVQQNFKPRHEDILLVTLPKSGTTWFKPLMFAVMNRTHFDLSTHPLLTTSPHDLVPFLELYLRHKIPFPNPDTFYPPQLFQTHIPFTSLSQYVMESQCRIVYICRNPKDVFVSTFYFLEKLRDKKLTSLSLEKAFELFCKGVSLYEEGLLFSSQKIAEFMGYPFSVEEEKQGVAHDILELCSFENLRNLKVNKTGKIITSNNNQVENHRFFRKGEVGDWKRHLTAEMEDGLNKLIEQKLAGSGLAFRDSSEA